MKRTRPLVCNWWSMARLRAKFAAFIVTIGWMAHAQGTGYYGPSEYLSDGGKNVTGTPEFYWELETKRLAKDFHAKEKLVLTPLQFGDEKVDQSPLAQATQGADINDFADALKSGAIKPADAAQATKQHEEARKFIAAADETTKDPLPAEFDSEFADYHKGAYAYRLGKEHWADARKAWEGLLKRPAGERHYRSVWAAFMLGKLAMKAGDPDAAKWFQQVRELAGEGFVDTMGMAADSYGWEGRTEWKQDHADKAARLFLTQLALGDESAVVSLKALIPDRDPVEGMLNYGPEMDDVQKWNEEEKKKADAQALEGLKKAAADPLLRRLVTAHILATESAGSRWTGDEFASGTSGRMPRSERWLKVIGDAKTGPVEDAEYLGWTAYLGGNYKEAQRWLDMAKGDSAVAEWLHAKLLLRAGRIADAAANLEKAFAVIRDPQAYTGWAAGKFSGNSDGPALYIVAADDSGWSMSESAGGDLGAVRLARGDFVQALDAFFKAGLWEDAAFVAERVLTADELKAYVDQLPQTKLAAKTSGTDTAADDADESGGTVKAGPAALRYLLGRRLVREDRYDEAVAYLKPPYDKILQKYTQALKNGADDKLAKHDRAKAWFTAAWLARYDGMEIMGTEVSPDGFVFGGDFESTDLAKERSDGKYEVQQQVDTKNGDSTTVTSKTVVVKNPFPASKQEIDRLRKNKISPDLRFHYRVIAGALAMKAADLMDDNTEELADVINTAGLWVKDRDEKIGDRYYQVLKKRCAKTAIGAKVLAKHWFADVPGPWSDQAQADYQALHAQLGDKIDTQ